MWKMWIFDIRSNAFLLKVLIVLFTAVSRIRYHYITIMCITLSKTVLIRDIGQIIRRVRKNLIVNNELIFGRLLNVITGS